ncbi:MAG TPA: glycine--tRNA ligase subunit beta [Thermosulfidibacter takaii]|uniref:glycine--tRNA ligase n=1 Tax=Thermosulfidibacter takaii TaxID=412593 RepID=A0A7C0Y9G2_9BACT|nr:glycine--tRNA ligase subunit beta [Thermosulfidibacter takaii]
MTRTLLFEIGTEEIPAGFMPPALSFMEKYIEKTFKNHRIDHGEIITMGTPRRLTLMVKEVAETQRDKVEEVMGPPAKVAFDAEGKPTKAAIGFAKGQGVAVEDLKVKETPKGAYVYVLKEEKEEKQRISSPVFWSNW